MSWYISRLKKIVSDLKEGLDSYRVDLLDIIIILRSSTEINNTCSMWFLFIKHIERSFFAGDAESTSTLCHAVAKSTLHSTHKSNLCVLAGGRKAISMAVSITSRCVKSIHGVGVAITCRVSKSLMVINV